MITIFKDIHTTSTPFWRDTNVVLDRIRDGKSKVLIEKIRAISEKSERDIFKKKLPSICFAGKFKRRMNDSCLDHSGLICLDFDNFPDPATLEEYRKKLTSDKYTYVLFLSPSGQGLKVIVRIPAEIENHKRYFDALREYYNTDYFDNQTSDISRVCYESYDPELYLNETSEVWTQKDEDQHYSYNEVQPCLPLKSESQIIQKLQKWFDRKFNMSKGERNGNLFVFASSMNEFGISESEARAHLSQYEQSDFSSKEIDRIVKSAYSKTERHNTKFFEDNSAKDRLKQKVQSGSDIKKVYRDMPSFTQNEVDDAIEQMQSSSTVSEFWEFDKNGKARISSYKFKAFLEQNGYCKYYPEGSDNYIFIKIENSFIENTSPQIIKDFVLDYVLERKVKSVYELLTFSTKLFKDDYLSLIKAEEIKLYEDADNYAMLYYRNCAIRVTTYGIEEIDYLNLEGMVWKHHVINRDYKKSDYRNCIFDRFIGLVASNDDHRKQALMTTIGYLLHSHKTSAKNKAVILNDEKISDNPNGGSGKGVICNAIGHIKRTCILDGKQFDFNKSFPYQTVSADTQVLIFDDVKKNFGFEALFSLITEGITLEKKNKDAIKIPVQRSPKIIITTNYTIGGIGGSFERRKHEVELSSYFSPTHTPLDEFGMMLFDEFTSTEWNRFDNFMVSCIQSYLQHGLITHLYENLPIRKFINDTSPEFYEYIKEGSVPLRERIYKTDKFNEFLEEYPDYKKWLKQKRFSMWIDSYALHLGKEVVHGKNQSGRWALIDADEEEVEYVTKNNEIIF